MYDTRDATYFICHTLSSFTYTHNGNYRRIGSSRGLHVNFAYYRAATYPAVEVIIVPARSQKQSSTSTHALNPYMLNTRNHGHHIPVPHLCIKQVLDVNLGHISAQLYFREEKLLL
jgi:hypothetical protein